MSVVAKIATAVPFVNIDFYGAKGEGRTDDTEAIDDALAAAESGTTVVFPFGTYISSSGYVVPDGLAILGYGAGRQLNLPSGGSGSVVACKTGSMPAALFTFAAAGVTLEDIQIDGKDRTVTVLRGAGFQHRIDGCEIRRGSPYGVHITHDVNRYENKIRYRHLHRLHGRWPPV
ncbi:hypothetical protein IFT73_16935 [Aeromicrobium sp. CFBP 8757]|uniref:glycosyl hydrolase family 28-related protein n=1 Tax=Aeromicrobium sp. CFBP 8757 TaxID=2775288 RepID=UPI001786EC0A|nr:hypothetical protein [Aeromicrobium sp. CFBP 8757]